MRRLIPINTDWGGHARCIKAGYFKMGYTNLTRELLGYQDGFACTAVIELYEDD